MRQELEEKLLHEFQWFEAHNIWTNEKLGFPTSCCFEDGWYDLIYNCLKEIDQLYKSKGADINTLIIEQLKEKYGGIRIYLGNYINGVNEIIDKYEKLSYHTCEVCGEVGEIRSRGSWLKCLCNNHMHELGYRKFK